MEFVSYAKWILAGEHTVVRGGKAIAFPLAHYRSSIIYEEDDKLRVNDEKHEDTFVLLLQRAATLTNVDFEDIRGKFTVENNIPEKSGLGSSAALCRNVAAIFGHLGFCQNISSLACRLEDTFHGKSSGLDVAVAMLNKPVVFKHNCVIDILENPDLSHLLLTYSGQSSSTSRCAAVIDSVFAHNATLAKKLDEQMNLAADLCEQGVRNSDFAKLKEGIRLGNDVFRSWGLCSENLLQHINSLMCSGAAAAKPIGSGLGGYVVSLWKQKPKKYSAIYLTLE
ncbi:MAG: hypothetical protein LBT70_04660 [Holosporaceae bacterium]|jgi:mevalonate kinase|nr:hypothetical protein [Holosporaceae bacterium]